MSIGSFVPMKNEISVVWFNPYSGVACMHHGASPRTGLEIVKMVKPKVAILYHAPTSERIRFAELLSKEAPEVRCMITEPSKPYKYP